MLAGPVAHRNRSCSFWRGLRTVAVDGTLLPAPDEPAITWRYLKTGRSAPTGALSPAAGRPRRPAPRPPPAPTRKNPTSKYGPNVGQHPTTSQNYTIHTAIAFFEHGLANPLTDVNATVLLCPERERKKYVGTLLVAMLYGG